MARKVHIPQSLSEVWSVWNDCPDAVPYHGGTDVIVHLRDGRVEASELICLERVSELKGVEDRGATVFIGAGQTHTEIITDKTISTNFPILTTALSVLGSPPIRHAGTLGGNLGTASPAGDSLPPLYCLGAMVHLRSFTGERTLPISEFILAPGRTALKDQELILGIEIPKLASREIHHFEKIGRRRALTCSIISLAALLTLDKEGRTTSARLAWGSVGPTVMTSVEVEQAMIGQPLTRAGLRMAARAARQAVQPISDGRASAEYRRLMAGNLVLRMTQYNPFPERI